MQRELHQSVTFEIDTGSAVNEGDLRHVPVLLPPASLVRSYTGQCVDVRGLFITEVEHPGEPVFLPISGQPNLLSRHWISRLVGLVSYIRQVKVNPVLAEIPNSFR